MTHATQRPHRPSTSTPSSSAPASPASAPRSSCRRPASRLPRRRAGQRRRRHLARQHLPRRRLRRPLASCTRFSFAPNPDWSRSFSPQPEIQAYLQRVAERVRRARPVPLRHHRRGRRLGRRGRSAGASAPTPASVTRRRRWSPAAGGALRARSCPTSRASTPSPGELFHSARWDHDYDLTGKRVAVIGTGASAIQIVPEIAEQVGAPRRLPAHRALGDAAPRPRLHAGSSGSRFRHLPRPAAAYRTGDLLGPRGLRARLHLVNPSSPRPPSKLALRQHRQRASPTRRCARRSRPTSEIGCKRILISNDYYPALDRDDVDLVTDGIARDHRRPAS